MAGRRPFKDVVKIERGERSCLMVVDMKIEVKYARRMNWRVYILYTLDWPVDLCEQPIQRETDHQIVCIKNQDSPIGVLTNLSTNQLNF